MPIFLYDKKNSTHLTVQYMAPGPISITLTRPTGHCSVTVTCEPPVNIQVPELEFWTDYFKA